MSCRESSVDEGALQGAQLVTRRAVHRHRPERPCHSLSKSASFSMSRKNGSSSSNDHPGLPQPPASKSLRPAPHQERAVGGGATTHQPPTGQLDDATQVVRLGDVSPVVSGRRAGAVRHVRRELRDADEVGAGLEQQDLQRCVTAERDATTQPADPPPTITTSYAMTPPGPAGETTPARCVVRRSTAWPTRRCRRRRNAVR